MLLGGGLISPAPAYQWGGTWAVAMFLGLSLDDFLVVEDAREIRGMMALWDQGAFQRLRIEGYSRELAFSRPFLNFSAQLRGGVPLPPRGRTIPVVKVSALDCADDDSAILRSLLGTAISMGAGRLLSIGLSEKDPLVGGLKGIRGKEFGGLHFLVGWEGEPPEWREPFGFDVARI